MARFKMAAVLITVFLTCGSFDKVNAMMDVGDQKGFNIDVLKRIDALEKENLQLRTKIGEMKQKMDLQSNETQKISDSFDIIKDELQDVLPKTSFGNATLEIKYSDKAIKIRKISPNFEKCCFCSNFSLGIFFLPSAKRQHSFSLDPHPSSVV